MAKTFLNWSSGKDAALALHYLQQDPAFEVAHLLTSVNAHFDRVSMHGLRRELLEMQLQAVGLPWSTVELPEMPDMEVYEQKMLEALRPLRAEGFTHAAFGDIFLEDLRAYREKQLANIGFEACFPLWKKDSRVLMEEFITLGFKAVIVCAKAELLGESFLGRELDTDFLADLPEGIDPCGENGEFHTFCYDGPIFQQPVKFRLGEKTLKEYDAPKQDEVHDNKQKVGFWYQDLLLEEN